MSLEKSSSEASKAAEPEPFRKILVGVDISDQTLRIFKLASYLSRALASTITVCSVMNIATSVKGNEMDGFPANEKERTVLDNLRQMIHTEFGSEGESIEVKILHGDPSERISEYAEYTGCDLIIIGSRGQGALKKALLGSVSSSVASRSKNSVLIVK